MNVLKDAPAQEVMNEISYFIALSVLKKLWKQGSIPLQECEKANVAIAEKYGVLKCQIQ